MVLCSLIHYNPFATQLSFFLTHKQVQKIFVLIENETKPQMADSYNLSRDENKKILKRIILISTPEQITIW